jgi:hypothetical protein
MLTIFRAYDGVTTSMTVRACWEKVVFTEQRRDGTFYFVVYEEKIRTAPDFQKIWERDYPIGSLSARWRSQKWEWLNQGSFEPNPRSIQKYVVSSKQRRLYSFV